MTLQWLPFGLLPSAREAGRPEPEIVQMRLPAGETNWLTAMANETVETVQAWSVDAVLKNFALRAAVWHVTAGQYAAGRRKPRTTRTELQQWIAHTRALADRLPFGGLAKASMTDAAARLEHDLDWPARHFTSWPPSLETKADADWRVNLSLWAADRLLREVNESEPEYASLRGAAEYLKIPATKFWPAMFDWFPTTRPALPFAVYKNAQQRVTNLDKTIRPGMRDALMIVQLRDVLTAGRFGPDEQIRDVESLKA